jgi:ribosomal protein S19
MNGEQIISTIVRNSTIMSLMASLGHKADIYDGIDFSEICLNCSFHPEYLHCKELSQ